MDKAYAARYANLYGQHWWWRAREEYLLETLRDLRPHGGWERILDIGCGNALFFERLKDFGEVEGIEADASVVDTGGPWASRIYVQPFDRMFEPGKTYDLLLMLDVLEHLPDPGAALLKSAELLTPRGHLVVTVPAFQYLWTAHDEVNGHVQRFTRREACELVAQAGFRVLQASYLFHWLWPLKVLIRLKERSVGPAAHATQPPPRIVNSLLVTVCSLERRLLRAASLPFGTSVLVVATRDRG